LSQICIDSCNGLPDESITFQSRDGKFGTFSGRFQVTAWVPWY